MTQFSGKQPAPVLQRPHSTDAEQQLLGSLLHEASARRDINLTPKDFYTPQHASIFTAIQSVDEPDLFSVHEWLARHNLLDKCGGDEYLLELRDRVVTGLNVRAYAGMVRNLSQRRQMLDAAQTIAQLSMDEDLAHSDLLAKANDAFVKATAGTGADKTVQISQVVLDLFKRLEWQHENKGKTNALATGFHDLDKLFGGGIEGGELIIVAARPGMGKTSLLLSIVSNIAEKAAKKPGMFYTLEMSALEQVMRLVSMQAGIDSQRLRTADLKDEEWNALTRVSMKLSNMNLFMNEWPMSIDEIRADARRLHGVHGLSYVMIDFLGLVDAPGDSDYQKASAVALGAKSLAKELGVPVFLACQLSRGVETRGGDKRPVPADLRDSGRIEEAGDKILMLYRDEYYNEATEFKNIAELLVRKNRNGPIGKVDLFFDKRLTAFKNISKERIEL